MGRKDSSLTIRISSLTKDKLKELAKTEGKTISEIVNSCLTELAERKKLNKEELEKLETRIAATDEKLLKLKNKLKGENK